MPRPAKSVCPLSRVRIALIAGACGLATVAKTPHAYADYARPPASPYQPDSPYRPDGEPPDYRGRYGDWSEPEEPEVTVGSLVRFHVGPAILFQPTSPGLFTALDIGRRSVGARLSGSWLRAESDQGLAAYSAELWIDFRHRYELHPIIGAGASWLHGGAVGEEKNAGAGVLRGSLEYELPISDADARVGIDLMGLLPAIGTERTRPWATLALTVAAGF